jgi:hypothetical protein
MAAGAALVNSPLLAMVTPERGVAEPVAEDQARDGSFRSI